MNVSRSKMQGLNRENSSSRKLRIRLWRLLQPKKEASCTMRGGCSRASGDILPPSEIAGLKKMARSLAESLHSLPVLLTWMP
jgi:hypothetical protein